MDIMDILNHSKEMEECNLCGKRFTKRCTMLRHQRNVHSLHVACQFCKKGLKLNSRPYAYKSHLLRCAVFCTTYSYLDYDQRIERAEEFSNNYRKRPKNVSLQQELNAVESQSLPCYPKKILMSFRHRKVHSVVFKENDRKQILSQI
eukprot:NODE_35_length_36362_cov_0.944434.p29 type:complete len:147 gc:universal NODE_35_length_36362_cov_0.944434:28928-28488(-)